MKIVQNPIFYYLAPILITLLAVYLLRILFWKSRKIEDIAEEYTSISLTDKYMMKTLNGVPGVWAQYVGNKCWNVCKTIDIGSEMSLDAKRCSVALENTLRKDHDIREQYTYQGSIAIRYRDLVKYAIRRKQKIRFLIVIKNIHNEDILEYEEMKFAIENKAIAWNPAPGKQRKAYFAWKNNRGDIRKYKKIFTEKQGG